MVTALCANHINPCPEKTSIQSPHTHKATSANFDDVKPKYTVTPATSQTHTAE